MSETQHVEVIIPVQNNWKYYFQMTFSLEDKNKYYMISDAENDEYVTEGCDTEILKREVYQYIIQFQYGDIEDDQKAKVVASIDTIFTNIFNSIENVNTEENRISLKLFNKPLHTCTIAENELINKLLGSKFFEKEWDQKPGLRALVKQNLSEKIIINKAIDVIQLRVLNALKNDKPVAKALKGLKTKRKSDKWGKYKDEKALNKIFSKLPHDECFPTPIIHDAMQTQNYFPESKWETILLCGFNHHTTTEKIARERANAWVRMLRNSSDNSLKKAIKIPALVYKGSRTSKLTDRKLDGFTEFLCDFFKFGVIPIPEDTIYSFIFRNINLYREDLAKKQVGLLRKTWPDWVEWMEDTTDGEWTFPKTKSDQIRLGNKMHFCIGQYSYRQRVQDGNMIVAHYTPKNKAFKQCTLTIDTGTLKATNCKGQCNNEAQYGYDAWKDILKKWQKHDKINKTQKTAKKKQSIPKKQAVIKKKIS